MGIISEEQKDGIKIGRKWLFTRPVQTKPEIRRRKGMGTLELSGIMFFLTCGGPYGVETAVKAGGPLIALIGLVVAPLVWGLPMGLMSAELACAMPADGGPVLWVAKAYGPMIGFMNGLLHVLGGIVDNALYPIIAVNYVKPFIFAPACPAGNSTTLRLLHGNHEPAESFGPTGLHPRPFHHLDSGSYEYNNLGLLVSNSSSCLEADTLKLYTWASGCGIVVITLVLNIIGVEVVGKAAAVLTLLVLLPFLVTVGFAAKSFNGTDLTVVPDPDASDLGVDWPLFLSVLLWANSGWDDAGSVAGSVQDPHKSYVQGMLGSQLLILLVYLLPIATGVCVLGWKEWGDGSFGTVARLAVGEKGGDWLSLWLSIASAVGCFGTFNSLICTLSLSMKCLSELEILPAIFGWTHPRFGTPVVSVVTCCLCCAGLCYFDFELVIQVGVFLYVLSLVFEFSAVLVLRYTQPQMPRPFVIPMSNGVLALYMSIPIALCFFTMAMSFRDKNWSKPLAEQCISNGPEDGGEANYEGCPVILTGGALVVVALLYGVWRASRHMRGLPVNPNFDEVLEGSEPLLAGEVGVSVGESM